MLRIRSRVLCAALLTIGLVGVVNAGTPASGLGQAWPNAADVSVNPHYHAYTFVLGGITYIQINDAAGQVLGAVGTSSGQFIVLPVGHSHSVVTPQQSADATNATPSASPSTVYNDGTTVITATPMSDGTQRLKASTNLICTDPAICGSQGGG